MSVSWKLLMVHAVLLRSVWMLLRGAVGGLVLIGCAVRDGVVASLCQVGSVCSLFSRSSVR